MQVLYNYNKLLEYSVNKKHCVFTPAKLTKLIRTVVNDADVKFKTQRDPVVSINTAITAGMYDPMEDQDNYASIEITIFFNPDQSEFQFDSLDYNRLFVDVCETILHEQCHQRQYQQRQWKELPFHQQIDVNNEEEYLSRIDEIEAYGASIAAELFMMNNMVIPPLPDLAINTTLIYQMYERVFSPAHEIVAQVKNFAIQYLEQFEEEHNVR